MGNDLTHKIKRALCWCSSRNPNWHAIECPANADSAVVRIEKLFEEETATLRQQLAAANELIEEWQCASLLVGSSGDPADIKPHHVETEIVTLRQQLDKEQVEHGCAEAGYNMAMKRAKELHAENKELGKQLAEAREQLATVDAMLDALGAEPGTDFAAFMRERRTRKERKKDA